ncbi:hypothetical protein [Microbispora sp. NPDC049125]|uniref:hypothetical protein n=1 Tax=Microbispora sp. NPDC049125 TaxID=3154929 RepID=UPI003466B8BE
MSSENVTITEKRDEACYIWTVRHGRNVILTQSSLISAVNADRFAELNTLARGIARYFGARPEHVIWRRHARNDADRICPSKAEVWVLTVADIAGKVRRGHAFRLHHGVDERENARHHYLVTAAVHRGGHEVLLATDINKGRNIEVRTAEIYNEPNRGWWVEQ